MKNGAFVKISLPRRRREDNGQLPSGKRHPIPPLTFAREGGRMIPGEVVPPTLETRLNLVSRRVFQLLGERVQIDLAELGELLQVPHDLACVAAGWLARSRVVDLIEDASGKLQVRLRRPFE